MRKSKKLKLGFITNPAVVAGNAAPTISATNLALVGGVLKGSYTYADAEGDPESNARCEVRNLSIAGTGGVGNLLTASFTFYSPSGYAQGSTQWQWYRQELDHTNRVAIGGATNDTYTPVSADAGKELVVIAIATQTAATPANGVPESLPVESAGVIIPVPFSLDTLVNHYLKKGTYDSVNKRALDYGTSGGGNYFTAPVGNEPTWDAGNNQLVFNPTVTQQFLNFSVIANTSGNRHLDIVGRAKWDDLNAIRTMFALVSNLDFRNVVGPPAKYSIRDSQTFTTAGSADTTEHSFRIRTSSSGGVVTIRLQIDKNTTNGTYVLDESLTLTNNGAAVAATTAKVGAGFSGTNGFYGKIKMIAFRLNTHIPDQYEDDMWNFINAL